METSEVVRRIWGELEPNLAEQGFELIEVEYGHESHGLVLRLFIDCEGGVTLDHCQAVSQLVGPLLDVSDVVDSRYMLEVSSPGFDRPIRKAADFERFAGEAVKLQAHAAVLGRKRFSGKLEGIRGDMVAVECDGESYEIHLENIKRCNLDR